MRRSVFLYSACLSVLGLLALPLAGGAKELSSNGVLLDRVAAVVNEGVVLQSELDLQIREIEARLRTQNVALPPEGVMRQQVLDRLVQEEIQHQHAERAGIRVSDEQVNAALEDIAKRQNLTLEQLAQKLTADGVDYAQYRAELKKEIARQLLRQRDVVQRIVVTPRELDQYLAHQKKTASAANEYNVAHILIAVAQDAKPAQLAQSRKLAHEIDDRAHNGEEFGALAVSYSQSESALEGGSLGWRKGTELPTFLADVIGRMKPGDVSDVLQTPSGFHIVKLLDTRAAGGAQIVQQIHLRHILVKPTEIEDDATVEQKLARERTARHPLRTYLTIPLRRAVRIWFTPRIELVPVSGNVFPLMYMRQEDPVDQRVTIFLFSLNIFYLALALGGAFRLRQSSAARAALSLFVLYILVRTAFLATLETPEPRYVLVCFPALIALAAHLFLPRTPAGS